MAEACGWVQSDSDDMDWIRYTGGTPSLSTGPDADHTDGSGYYMYVEASNLPERDANAVLLSPAITSNASRSCLTFWYNMYGSDVGSLTLFTTTANSTNLSDLQAQWSKSGDQGPEWKEATVPLDTSVERKLVFEAFYPSGASWQGDMAIDDVTVLPGDCPLNVECHKLGMIINIYPYGYDPSEWILLVPPTTTRCPLQTVPSFVERYPGYRRRNWQGFAAGFYHKNDKCAGSAYTKETATHFYYARRVFVFYNMNGRHPTDNFYTVVCAVQKGTPTSPPEAPHLPSPRVTYTMIDARGQPLRQPVRIGQTVGVVFRLLPIPNRSYTTDMKIERCTLTDNKSDKTIAVVRNGCIVEPIGRRLFKPRDHLGISILVMTTYRFPGTSNNFNILCKARLCKAADLYCRKPYSCSSRDKRSVSRQTRQEEDGDHYIVRVPLYIS
ncbi:hypothetical protein BaRGS_00039407 [Batillaria attramentaria]|uniref:Uncharacterized protein n=1 Tax=Batillaria attramentaria TaxID=370345 RepID=A0ABD0J380_9CAEN